VDIARIIVGLMVLTLGRKLFWLFVGAVGFVLGISLVSQLFSAAPFWLVLVIASVAGVLGAVLALFVQHVAIGLAGFIGGGYVLISVLDFLGLQVSSVPVWLIFLIGGIIGLILIMALFSWTLVVLSSLTGASLVVQGGHLNPEISAILFVVLVIVGLVVQANLLRREGVL
jgi:hypothetical protein